MRFDRLEDKSGVDWKAGYDPNGSIKKNGWHGEFDHSGIWVMVDDKEEEEAAGKEESVNIEIIRNGSSAILYDSGMVLLKSPLLKYVTDDGQPYGNLELDRGRMLAEIRETLKKMELKKIGVIGGIDPEKPELVDAYKEVLKELAVPGLKAVDVKAVVEVKETYEREARERAVESAGVGLERKLRTAGSISGNNAAILASVTAGSLVVPLSVKEAEDGKALGLSEGEQKEISRIPVRAENKRAYETILCNLYAAWPLYEWGLESKAKAARLVNERLESGGKSGELTINAQTSLGEIIRGEVETCREGVKTCTSGIPGVFAEAAVVDFYDDAEKEKYVTTLERKRVLPKGGAAATLTALKTMPEGSAETKAKLNKGLTRALGQYKAISMSTGLPLGELVEVVKAEAEGKGGAVLGLKVYYEVPMEELVKEAMGENRQTKEVRLDEAAGSIAASEIIVGGASGPALDEAELIREKLIDGCGFSAEEAKEAEDFLHSIRFSGKNPVVPAFLAEAMDKEKASSFKELRHNILSALDTRQETAYNLSSKEGMRAYFEGSRAGGVNRKELDGILREELAKTKYTTVPSFLVSKLEPMYRAQGGGVPFTRSTPRGNPERIRLDSAEHTGSYAASRQQGGASEFDSKISQKGSTKREEARVVPFERYTGKAARSVIEGRGANMPIEGRNTIGNTAPVIQFPKQARDTELERLRRIEANYEKDKAALAREKQPALARSESHDVGHAGKIEDDENLDKIARLRQKAVIDELRKREGV
jgi:hypothetical protein